MIFIAIAAIAIAMIRAVVVPNAVEEVAPSYLGDGTGRTRRRGELDPRPGFHVRAPTMQIPPKISVRGPRHCTSIWVVVHIGVDGIQLHLNVALPPARSVVDDGGGVLRALISVGAVPYDIALVVDGTCGQPTSGRNAVWLRKRRRRRRWHRWWRRRRRWRRLRRWWRRRRRSARRSGRYGQGEQQEHLRQRQPPRSTLRARPRRA